MNQEKIGQFIAMCRKEKGFTQATLAQKLGITDRAVSKWENGRCLPDASFFLELCSILNISVNELLTGERINMEDYKNKAEENLVELRKLEEQTNRKLLNTEKIFGTIACVSCVTLMMTASYCMETSKAVAIFNYILGFAILIVTVIFGIKIEHEAGYYECPNCKYRYVPTLKSIIFAPHFGYTRKMRCPNCNKRSYQKKVLTKD